MKVLSVSTMNEFDDEVLNSDKTVLVDFWAEWCAPCRMMAPILDNIAKKMADDVKIVKVNIEASADNGQLAQDYDVRGIPNMQVFKGGKVVDELVGVRAQMVLEDELKTHI